MSFGLTCALMSNSSWTGEALRWWPQASPRPPQCGNELDDNATHGRANFDALDDVQRGSDLFVDIVEFRFGLTQFLDRLLDIHRMQIGNPLVRARDALVRICDAPYELAEITRKAGLCALQGQHFRLAQELALEKRLLAFQLFGKERKAFVGGFHLGFVTSDALLQPRNLPLQNQHLSCQTGPASDELSALAIKYRPDLRIVTTVRRKLWWN